MTKTEMIKERNRLQDRIENLAQISKARAWHIKLGKELKTELVAIELSLEA